MNRIVLIASAALLFSCGGNYSQAGARDRAADKMCDCYQRANEIGAGSDAKYANRDQCVVDQRAFFNDAWPVKECDGRISSESLDTCTKSIEVTDCGNGFDLLNTAFNKCGKDKVCG